MAGSFSIHRVIIRRETHMFFQTIFVAMLALLLGLAVCFAGFRLFVILLPIWAFFAGFGVTAQAIQDLFGGGFLATVASWAFALVVAILFAVAAYFFYYAAVVLLAAIVGYEIGGGIVAALGMSSGFLHFIVGLVLALALSVAVVFFNLPRVFIIVLTALAGAEMIMTGVLLALNRVSLSDLQWGDVGAFLRSSWFWGLAYLAIAGAGVAVQLLLPHAYSMKPYWEDQGTFEAPTPETSHLPAAPAPTYPSDTSGPEVPAT